MNCQTISPLLPAASVTMFGSECSISGFFFMTS
ncbi:Uncharacterised protein [Mycobacterium tuberculosis]|nr:Uncharacterised protein [Mycobacterium tuberculosis]